MGEIKVMREDLRPPAPPPKRHFISIKDVSRDDLERLRLGQRLDREHLVGLHVRAHGDDQVGVAFQQAGVHPAGTVLSPATRTL